MADELFEDDIYILTDEEGNENKFELQGSLELDGITYLALIPIDETDDEFVILKVETDEDGEEILVTIDDDDEFDKIADIFQDELFSNIDYDDDNLADDDEI